jgi:hypothetical protein
MYIDNIDRLLREKGKGGGKYYIKKGYNILRIRFLHGCKTRGFLS